MRLFLNLTQLLPMLKTILDMIFDTTYYLELHTAISFSIFDAIFYQVKLLMFYNTQTIDSHLLVKYEVI